MQQEHDNLRANLAAATKEPGALGGIAREVALVLEPHFAREEELVYPALGLLPAVVEGTVTPEMVESAAMARHLKAELPTMLEEHRKVREGLQKLRVAAEAAGRPTYERFADALVEHIETEEEVLYLSAILVGEYVMLRLGLEHAASPAAAKPPSQTWPPGRRG